MQDLFIHWLCPLRKMLCENKNVLARAVAKSHQTSLFYYILQVKIISYITLILVRKSSEISMKEKQANETELQYVRKRVMYKC